MDPLLSGSKFWKFSDILILLLLYPGNQPSHIHLLRRIVEGLGGGVWMTKGEGQQSTSPMSTSSGGDLEKGNNPTAIVSVLVMLVTQKPVK